MRVQFLFYKKHISAGGISQLILLGKQLKNINTLICCVGRMHRFSVLKLMVHVEILGFKRLIKIPVFESGLVRKFSKL
jgi:hypothetical protein